MVSIPASAQAAQTATHSRTDLGTLPRIYDRPSGLGSDIAVGLFIYFPRLRWMHVAGIDDDSFNISSCEGDAIHRCGLSKEIS